MKKFFKKVIEILRDFALMYIMLVSAQRCMNLPFSWAGIGYLVAFSIGLTLWTFFNPASLNIKDISSYKEENKEENI